MKYTDELSTEKEMKLIDIARSVGIINVTYDGGEPLLRSDIYDIGLYAKKRGLTTSIVTNGFLLKEKAQDLEPFDVVIVSVDALGKTHDEIRGVKGLFEKAVKGIKVVKNVTRVVINCVLSDTNLEEVEDLIFFADDLGIKGITFEPLQSFSGIDLNLTQLNKYEKTLDKIIELKKRKLPILNSLSYLRLIKKRTRFLCKPYLLFLVDPLGKLTYPCGTWNNVYQGRFSVFDLSKDEINILIRKIQTMTKNCYSCYFACYVEPSLALGYDMNAIMNWLNNGINFLKN
jgi:MoaA/NifB/PqqE/SkfB family radical SAM enzyme